MKYRAVIVAVILMVALLANNTAKIVKAQSNKEISSTYAFQLNTNNQDSTFQDLYDDKDYSFETMPYWKTNKVTVQLDYSLSQLTDPDSSSVTLSINGKPFFSFHPKTSKNPNAIEHIAVVIPQRFINNGSNTLRINSEINTRNSDRICRTNDTNDWLTVYKTSQIRVDYNNKHFSSHVSDFFERFSGVDVMTKHDNSIAVSDQATHSEFKAAAYSLIGVNQFSSTDPSSASTGVSINHWNSRSLKGKHWILLISEYNHLPSEIKKQIPSKNLKSEAIIKVVSFGNKQVAVVTSMNADALIRTARLIADQSLLKQMNSSSAYISKQMNMLPADQNFKTRQKIVTSSDQVIGPFHHEKNYYFTVPVNQVLAAGSRIHLQLRYAKNLDFNRSLVTVSINNTPVGSKKLTKDHADSDSLDLTVPKDIRVSGNFTINVSYDLEMDGLKCARIGSKTPWALITPQSFIQIYTKEEKNKLFQSYPFPFLSDGQLNHVAVVLPSEKNDSVYESLSNALSLIAKNAQTNNGSIDFYNDDVDKQKIRNKNIITIGTYLNNGLIREINKNLYYKYDRKGQKFLSNEKMLIDQNYGQTIGTLQLVDAPFSKQNEILVITAPHHADMKMASKLIGSEINLSKISGDGVFVDRDNRIQSNRYKKIINEDKNSANLFSRMKHNSGFVWILSITSLMLLTLATAIILLIFKYRKRNESDHEKK
ncbi:cellulose biosynthesis cyclic di-GMP-binding regulatory protein BcsB [Sporolactobacillus sp. CPB3-1]|uniref:Cellulose biosynthesis cyclic di-GMP-binding regulatory protein BcsB n=1 Tax=Sporolactobacillus mangiferae TaxID=2940498 RepID=A0ABT0M6I5_9BACL|nr:cellulose biosynthesis cyclic di-GMP-binding regulatory protein BcsB [Sporolactobacillus mangiferae]MCL1630477.1 cellulose biosynthesis cyclic di-GMP-binding regulatory protein BcsB [Sporolactobacillus mangiferae]